MSDNIDYSFMFTIKLSYQNMYWSISLDPHLDLDCDVIYKTSSYDDAAKFFNTVLPKIDPKYFIMTDIHYLPKNETLAIFKSQGPFEICDDDDEESKDE